MAPYEADAQIAYMVKNGLANFAISEDSDLIAYGCPKILMKVDHKGNALVWDHAHFKSMKINADRDSKLLPLKHL